MTINQVYMFINRDRNKNLLAIVIDNITVITSVQLLISHHLVYVFSLFLYDSNKNAKRYASVYVCRLITHSCRSVLSVVATAM